MSAPQDRSQWTFADDLGFVAVVAMLLWAGIGFFVAIGVGIAGHETASYVLLGLWALDMLVLMAVAAAGDD